MFSDDLRLGAVAVRTLSLEVCSGDTDQAVLLEAWLTFVHAEYGDNVLAFDADAAQTWGQLRVPNPEDGIDKQIAATALVNDLMLVTRNAADLAGTGVRLLNPFVHLR